MVSDRSTTTLSPLFVTVSCGVIVGYWSPVGIDDQLNSVGVNFGRLPMKGETVALTPPVPSPRRTIAIAKPTTFVE